MKVYLVVNKREYFLLSSMICCLLSLRTGTIVQQAWELWGLCCGGPNSHLEGQLISCPWASVPHTAASAMNHISTTFLNCCQRHNVSHSSWEKINKCDIICFRFEKEWFSSANSCIRNAINLINDKSKLTVTLILALWVFF